MRVYRAVRHGLIVSGQVVGYVRVSCRENSEDPDRWYLESLAIEGLYRAEAIHQGKLI